MLGEIDVPTLVVNVQPVVNAHSGSLFFKFSVSRSQLTDWTHVNVHIHQLMHNYILFRGEFDYESTRQYITLWCKIV